MALHLPFQAKSNSSKNKTEKPTRHTHQHQSCRQLKKPGVSQLPVGIANQNQQQHQGKQPKCDPVKPLSQANV
jgi:hypothetical protein